MSKYTLNVDDRKVLEQIENVLEEVFDRQIKEKYSRVDDALSSAVRELVLSKREEVIDRAVEKAADKIVELYKERGRNNLDDGK